MGQYDCPDNRDLPVKTRLPVRLLGREPFRTGTVGQADDMDASGVLSSVVGQGGAAQNEPIGKPVHVRPVRLGQVKQLSSGPGPVLSMNVERHARRYRRPEAAL